MTSPGQRTEVEDLGQVGGASNLSKEFVERTGVSLLPSVAKALEGLIHRRIAQKEGTTYRGCDRFLSTWVIEAGRAPLG